MAVDSSGNVYIADTQNRTIRRSGAVTAPTIVTQPVSRAVALLHGRPARIETGGGLIEARPADGGIEIGRAHV